MVEEGPLQSAPYVPDIALLMTGMNDLLLADPDSSRKRQAFLDLVDPEIMPTSVGYIADTLTSIRARNSSALIALASLPAGGNPVGLSPWAGLKDFGDAFTDYIEGREYLTNKNYRRFNHALQQAAVAAVNGESPVIFVDQHTGFVGDPGVQFDRIHPTYGGQQQIADAYARALANYWESDGTCALPDVTPYANPANSTFLIGDFNADGCDQDIAYRRRSGASWSNRWMILVAGGDAPYPLKADTTGVNFSPGDLQQFVATVDFDLDGLLDIIWRNDSDTAWQINFGDPGKSSLRVADNYSSSAPAFDLASTELVVMFCNWGTATTIGWTSEIERENPAWFLYSSEGRFKQTRFAGDWRSAPFWQSTGEWAKPPCSVVGNH
jgi:lysophospholipase L1-like esterase